MLTQLLSSYTAHDFATKKLESEERERSAKRATGLHWTALLAVVAFAGMCLYLGKDTMAEKLLIAALGFLGGLGYSKSRSG